MKTVKKSNKILSVADEQLNGYLNDGFDEIDDKTGKIISVSQNKAYSVAEVEKLKAEYETQIAALQKKLSKNKDEKSE